MEVGKLPNHIKSVSLSVLDFIYCSSLLYVVTTYIYLWLALILLFYLLQSESSRSLVRGLVLLNCAGGMNNKAIVDDWRIKLLLPLLWLFDFLLRQRGIASTIFQIVRKRYHIYIYIYVLTGPIINIV